MLRKDHNYIARKIHVVVRYGLHMNLYGISLKTDCEHDY